MAYPAITRAESSGLFKYDALELMTTANSTSQSVFTDFRGIITLSRGPMSVFGAFIKMIGSFGISIPDSIA